MLILTPIFRFFVMIRRELSPRDCALAVTLGMLLGFTPVLTVQFWLLLTCLFVIRLNFAFAVFSWLLFELLNFAISPLFHQMGLFLLARVPFLRRYWAWMYHAEFIPFTRFNNTVVLGSAIFCLLFAVPFYHFAQRNFEKWLDKFLFQLRNTNSWRAWTATRIYRFYVQYRLYHYPH